MARHLLSRRYGAAFLNRNDRCLLTTSSDGRVCPLPHFRAVPALAVGEISAVLLGFWDIAVPMLGAPIAGSPTPGGALAGLVSSRRYLAQDRPPTRYRRCASAALISIGAKPVSPQLNVAD